MTSLPPSAQPKSGEPKLQSVQRLLSVLTSDLTARTLTAPQRTATLEQLKIYGRDPSGSDPIFTQEGIKTLCAHGFDNYKIDLPSSLEALRCLANALLIVSETRQVFVDLGYAERAAERFESDSADDEFLLARILFLITYETTVDLRRLLEEFKLGGHVNKAVTRHAEAYSRITEAAPPTPMQEMALSETLKLIFNIAHFIPDKAGHFSSYPTLLLLLLLGYANLLRSIPNIFKILVGRALPAPPLQAPVIYLINALLALDLAGNAGDVFPFSDSNVNIARLIEILDLATKEESFDEVGAPLLTLLRRMNEIAPEHVKLYMKKRLLPSEEERDRPLGQSTTLASHLLNLTSSSLTPATRDHVSSLLFELSSSNAEEYVRNVGYGYASGLLMTRGLQISPSALTPSSNAGSARAVNPITGQTLETEQPAVDPLGEMTEEEKEREAERLFVLFERCADNLAFALKTGRRAWANVRARGRLKKTGVMNIKNPVQQAVEEGRFEEVD